MEQNFNNFENQQQENVRETENQIRQDIYDENEYIQPVYPSSMVAARKRLNPLAIIIPVAVLVIAGVVAAILLLTGKPSYRKAEEKYFGSLMSALSEAETLTENAAAERVKVDVSIPLSELAGTDFSNMSMQIDTATRDGNFYGQIKAALGDKSILAEDWVDLANNKMYLLFPDASDIYAVMEFPESRQQSSNEEYMEAIRQVLNKTAETYFEIVEEPEVIRNQSFEIEGETYTADKSVIHLNTQQVATICKAFFDNMLENEKTTEMLCYMSGCETKEEFIEDEYSYIQGNLEEAINGSDEYDVSFDMTVYMRKNTVIGREILLSDNDIDEHYSVGFYQIPTAEGETVYLHYRSFEEEYPDEYEEFTLLCNDNAQGDVHSGSIAVYYWDNTYYYDTESNVTADYSNLAITDELFQGNVTVKTDGDDGFTANVELKKEGQDKIVKVTVPNICAVTLTCSPSDMEFKEIPVLSEGEYVSISSDYDIDYDSEAYSKFSDDMERYIDNLIGLGRDLPEIDYETTVASEPYYTEEENFSVMAGTWKLTNMVFPSDMDIDGESIDGYIETLDITYYISESGLMTAADESMDLSDEEYQLQFYGYGDYSFYCLEDSDVTGQYFKENDEIVLYSEWSDMSLYLTRAF